MSRGLLYWVLMLLWVVLSFWGWWPAGAPYTPASFAPLGLSLLLFALLLLVGWELFGAPVRGGPPQ